MKLPVLRLPKIVWLLILGSVLFVCFCYVASQWYYSRWDVASPAFRVLGYSEGAGGLFTIEEIRATLAEDNYIGADDPLNRSPELVENINAFETWLFKHPFVKYDEYSPEVLAKQFNAAQGDEKTELGWRIIDQFDHAHDFMIQLMELYATEQLPFERDSEPYQYIKRMIDGYCHILDAVDDPFRVEAFRQLQLDIEADTRAWENDPNRIRIQREADSARQKLVELEQMLQAYDQPSNAVKQTGNAPWIIGSTVPDFTPAPVSTETMNQTVEPKDSVSPKMEDMGGSDAPSIRIDDDSPVDSTTQDKTPLSPERFENAQQLIDQYGTEEGLRRLRESDPEAARQFEQERRPAPSRDVPDREQSESGSKD